MLYLRRSYQCGSEPRVRHAVSLICVRHASLTSSISAGVRKAGQALARAEERRIRQGTLAHWEMRDSEKVNRSREVMNKSRNEELERRQRLRFLSSDATVEPSPEANRDVEKGLERNEMMHIRKKRLSDPDDQKARARAVGKGILVDPPLAVPYTHAASQFLYGTFAVHAALEAGRRKFYKLYIWCGKDGTIQDDDPHTGQIVRMARSQNVPIVRVAWKWDRMLDKMSDGRPHNGLILEASAIPQMFAKSLAPVEDSKNTPLVNLLPISNVERANFGVSPGASVYPLPTRKRLVERFPFFLWLDRVNDTGNMGAVLRSAHYFGVDGIILPRHGTAPMSPATVKASAGAAEHVPILIIEDELAFMKACQGNGWLFYAAGAPESKSTLKKHFKDGRLQNSTFLPEHHPQNALQKHPLILMMGNEDEGLRRHLQKQADYPVHIDVGQPNRAVDSLNVSVAAALLSYRFLAPFMTIPSMSAENHAPRVDHAEPSAT